MLSCPTTLSTSCSPSSTTTATACSQTSNWIKYSFTHALHSRTHIHTHEAIPKELMRCVTWFSIVPFALKSRNLLKKPYVNFIDKYAAIKTDRLFAILQVVWIASWEWSWLGTNMSVIEMLRFQKMFVKGVCKCNEAAVQEGARETKGTNKTIAAILFNTFTHLIISFNPFTIS